ncbi:MAG TPA: argininosuccinate lyase, partial [Opitutaceae bacterium]|nr:argininosuccinate lyase [Opitutaceae bacterium]
GTLEGTQVNRHRCEEAVRDPLLLATDLADYLVMQGVPFREAHHAVGAVVKLAEANNVRLDQLSAESVREVHPKFGNDWAQVFDLKRAMAMRKGTGMPGPAQVKKQLARWRRLLTP